MMVAERGSFKQDRRGRWISLCSPVRLLYLTPKPRHHDLEFLFIYYHLQFYFHLLPVILTFNFDLGDFLSIKIVKSSDD